MQRLRLAILARRFWPGMGSAETLMSELACGLADRGCEVTVVTARRFPRWSTRIDFHGFPVLRVGPMADGFWHCRQASAAVDAWLKQHIDQIDLVYVLGLQDDAATAVCASGGRKPVVLAPLRSGRHGDCCCQVARLGRRKIKKACLQADAFLAYSPAVHSELEAAGYPRGKIHDVCFGIGPAEPRAIEAQSLVRSLLAEANGMLFLPAKTQLVVCTSRPGADSGWQALLAAWALVIRECTTVRLWLVGEPACRGAMLRRINELGLETRVQIIGAMDSVEAVLAAADVLVAPSPHGSHMAILEALAAGLPTVAADVAVNRWLLTPGANAPARECTVGLLVPPGDPQALADALVRILSTPKLANELSAAAWHRASQNFTLAKMLDDHLTLFETLLASHPGKSA